MHIILNRLELRNFKGVRNFTLDLSGQSATVYGRNGVGKTTLKDAFLWLLFDKDSEGHSQFSIKTIDEDGKPLSGLEHEVEAHLQVDGRTLRLRKMYKEIWTKKRGAPNAELTGHETLCWVDEVPLKTGEYKTHIASLVDERLFRLLTSPNYFHAMPWQDRRKALLDVCGQPTAEEVMQSNPQLAGLIAVLDGHSIDQYSKIIHERMKRLNDEIKTIPVRIDELTRSMPSAEVNYSAIEAELAEEQMKIDAVDKQMNDATAAASAVREMAMEATRIERAMVARQTTLQNEASAEFNALKSQEREAQEKLNAAVMAQQSSRNMLENMEADIARTEEQLTRLRAEWEEVYAESIPEIDPSALRCPTCGQALPDGDARKQCLREEAERKKKEALASINHTGALLKTQQDAKKGKADEIRSQLEAHQNAIVDLEMHLVNLRKDAENALPDEINPMGDAEYYRLTSELEAINAQLQMPQDDALQALRMTRAEYSVRIETLKSQLRNREIAESSKNRIIALKAHERELARQIQEMEGQQYLMELYVTSQAELIEDKVNQLFDVVRFKLFNTQVNGGVIECCEATINGVPYSDANSASKINGGLDILNTLSRHYGIQVPIFVDHGESVCNLHAVDSQLVNLVVSANDNALRVELNDQDTRVVA